ncbi:outer membrane protein assembly factor BamB family protein [Mucisphaera calidilacus]|uniref:Outer membrane protein assembly factor BamB n=1 Tax=Mucisphaera calidilacus TaxID=2527982 RepID=A0A518BXJ8_9BACT|nr:PQQ-binding-like beta-propeller repeat protein [Mucisphaera calidilacus]QDU71702.1 Outer membrane protein assembly factor BamB precursor [Mucisphaera calidilacus]
MRRILVLVVVLACCVAARGEVEDFTFLQVSDMHLNPRPEGAAYEPDGRSVKAMAWVAGESGKEQSLEPYQVTAVAPDLTLFTGDLFEYSVIGDTWGDLERALAGFRTTNYLMPGNHDNTWASITPKLRALYMHREGINASVEGHYAFTHKGVRFIQLNTSGLLEAVPAIPRGMLTWLRGELDGLDPSMPIIVSMHHPLIGSRSYASEYDTLRLHEVLRGRNVVLLLDGHWHSAQVRRWHQYDSVCGGSTFGKNTGYNIISIQDGMLRVAYRYKEDPLGMDGLVEKRIDAEPAYLKSELVIPASTRHGEAVRVSLRVTGGDRVTSARLRVDGDVEGMLALEQEGASWSGVIETSSMVPGRHFLAIEAERADGAVFTRAGEFFVEPDPGVMRVERRQLVSGVKAGMIPLDDGVMLASVDGAIYQLGEDLRVRVVMGQGGQIVHGFAGTEDRLFYGRDSGYMQSSRYPTVKERMGWMKNLNEPLYAPAVVADGVVYVGDASGRVHALDATNGEPIWKTKVAAYGIEAACAVTDELVIVGAWDGFIHALDRETGEQRWSVWNAKGQTDRKSRYYGPADSAPVVMGERLFVTDRGYVLGAYTLEGEFEGVVMEGITAISRSEDGEHFYGRGLSDRVMKFDAEGEVVWEVEVPAGRLPVPATERGGRVAVTSNDGLLSVLDAEDGSLVAQVRVSPGLYVQAPAAIDAAGRVYVADLDGVVTRVTLAE